MTQTEIDNILKKHAAWLRGDDGGERANLRKQPRLPDPGAPFDDDEPFRRAVA